MGGKAKFFRWQGPNWVHAGGPICCAISALWLSSPLWYGPAASRKVPKIGTHGQEVVPADAAKMGRILILQTSS